MLKSVQLPGQFEQDGFAIVERLLEPSEIDALVCSLPPDAYAMRNLLEHIPVCRDLAAHKSVSQIVGGILGAGAFPVRATFFDKRAEANWLVPWHQDLTIAVRRRIDSDGFGPWTEKAGIPHVQPPVGILEGMVAVRIHLDDCGPDNGPLRVLPGSHRAGRLSAEQIAQWRETGEAVTCHIDRGGALLMRPLLLHASSAAKSLGHRRVIHIEYAAAPLPGELEWRT